MKGWPSRAVKPIPTSDSPNNILLPFPLRGGYALPNSDLTSSLLFKSENRLALEGAIMELSNWVEQRGSAKIAANVRGTLEGIDKNEELIKMKLAVMMAPERLQSADCVEKVGSPDCPRTDS
jgi:hypothetical protein